MHQIPKKALGEFFRVIKPGRGVRLSCTKYDHPDFKRSFQSLSKRTLTSRWNISTREHSMPAKRVFLTWGALHRMLEKQGFFKTSFVEDLSEKHQTYVWLYTRPPSGRMLCFCTDQLK